MKSNKNVKKMFVLLLGLFTIAIASGCSCTNSMCSEADEQNIKKSIEKQNINEWRSTAAVSNTMKVETDEYKAYAEAKVNSIYLTDVSYTESECGKTNSCTDDQLAQIKSNIKTKYNNEWLNALEELSPGETGYIKTRTDDFQTFVNTKVEEVYKNHPKACLVTVDDVDPSTGAKIEAKKWGDAWKEGLLEGLIVYPIGWLLSSLSEGFGGGGLSQFFAILISVFIIRILMLLINFKGQLGSIKMQTIQGDLARIQEKLRDPKLTDQEKQALTLKMLDIYKANGINPFSTIFTQFLSFPIFIAVWAAMNQTLAIRKGTLWGLKFGDPINTQVFSGSITAIVLFLLMIAGQVVTMRLSMWLKLRKEKKKNPNYVKPKQTETEKQTNMMMMFMIGMVVMSGFLLPAALVIYWFLGSVFSIIQTVAFSSDYVNEKLKCFANRKKQAKVIR